MNEEGPHGWGARAWEQLSLIRNPASGVGTDQVPLFTSYVT